MWGYHLEMYLFIPTKNIESTKKILFDLIFVCVKCIFFYIIMMLKVFGSLTADFSWSSMHSIILKQKIRLIIWSWTPLLETVAEVTVFGHLAAWLVNQPNDVTLKPRWKLIF